MEIIRDLLWLWILGALAGTGYIFWTLYGRDTGSAVPPGGKVPQQITTRRTQQVAPASPPPAAPAAPVRTGLPASAGEHQRRGAAPTVKLPIASTSPREASEDQAAADLFGGLAAAKAKADAAPPIAAPAPPQLAPPAGVVEQAERLEERGFHVGTAKTETMLTAPPAAPGQPRSQTAELDDILKRIDAVLSESGAPQSEATLGGQPQGGQPTMPVPQTPPTEKLERKETDPGQQKLF